jgi:hypothetical protein
MTSMKDQSLWPIWPGNSGLESLEDQLKAFSCLEVAVICADGDKLCEPLPTPRVSPKARSIRYDHNGFEVDYGSRASSPNTCITFKKEPTLRVPTLRTVFDLSEQLRSLCVGLCMDCSKGNDVCRSPHPEPWAAYRAGLNSHFAQKITHEEVVEAELQADVIRAGFNNGGGGWGAY